MPFLRLVSRIIIILVFVCRMPFGSAAQNSERVVFDPSDSTAGYYLAIPSASARVKGVVVLLTSFWSPESLLAETKLHNVASANDLLTVFVSTKQKLYADADAVTRMNTLLMHVISRYKADTSRVALVGFDEAGNIALRYTELANRFPSKHTLVPKAVIGIDSPVDLFELWEWAQNQIKKNYWQGAVGDARFYIETMMMENGMIDANEKVYADLTPFHRDNDSTGNEQYLKNTAVRLYYDTDIEWQLANRRNSFYDTKIPAGSELIKRLMLLGNDKAQFRSARQPGFRSNGDRHPTALSIVDEVECIQWIKQSLEIFNHSTWQPSYALETPAGWGVEHFELPAGFAPTMSYSGVEDIRFAPGWGDSTKTNYWSYAYLWWLSGTPKLDAETLQANLQAYYTGLVGANIDTRQIPVSQQVPTRAVVRKAKLVTGDLETFEGTVQLLDYMTRKPITLNARIHVKDCSGQRHKAVWIEISPKPFTHPVWLDFTKLNQGFRCLK